jgi:hypothetical protein
VRVLDAEVWVRLFFLHIVSRYPSYAPQSICLANSGPATWAFHHHLLLRFSMCDSNFGAGSDCSNTCQSHSHRPQTICQGSPEPHRISNKTVDLRFASSAAVFMQNATGLRAPQPAGGIPHRREPSSAITIPPAPSLRRRLDTVVWKTQWQCHRKTVFPSP